MSISRRGPVTLSTLTFPNINLTKTIPDSLETGCNNVCFPSYTFNER